MAPARRSLFSKPAWASKSTPDTENSNANKASATTKDEEEIPIFSSKHIYEDIVAQERRRREKHAQRVKEKEEKQRLKLASPNDAIRVGDAKKRRVSSNHDRTDESAGESGNGSDSDTGGWNQALFPDRDGTGMPNPVIASDQVEGNSSTTNQTQRKGKRKTRSAATDHISLDTDDESISYDEDNVNADDPRIHTSKSDPESEEEDEYLRELKRKAREQARLKKFGSVNNRTLVTDDARGPLRSGSNTPDLKFAVSPDPGDQNSIQGGGATSVADDPEVMILINTMIPNAKSLVVSRRASQPLDLVKEFWCQRNQLNPNIASKVFFTWRGTRLYKASTLRGVLETLKKANPKTDGSDPSNGKIILEAVTDEIFEHRQRQQERRRKEAAEASSNGDNSNPEAETTGPPPEESAEVHQVEKSGVVIRLVCPEVEAVDIRLRPHTTVSKIIAAFCKLREIDPSRQCWLTYDGERLEGSQTAEEIGFDMNDSVDVYLR